MDRSKPLTQREVELARILRPLGRNPMTQVQAERAGQLLGLHWATVYKLRARFLRDPVTSSLLPSPSGRLNEPHRLPAAIEAIVTAVVERWLPRQRELAHPFLDAYNEVRQRCSATGLKSPARNTVVSRIRAHREAELALQSAQPDAEVAPGSFGATWPLELVQIDHTPADAYFGRA